MSRITLVATASPCAHEMRQFISASIAYRESSADDVDLLIVDDLRLTDMDDFLAGFSNRIPVTVVRPLARGQLSASIQALQSVQADAVITIDPDMHLNISDIDAFIGKWREGKQLVYGVRVLRTDVSWIRLHLSRAFNVVIRVLFNVPVRDINTPMLLVAADIIPDIVRHDAKKGLVKVYFPHVLKDRFDEVEIRVMSPKKVSAYSYSRLFLVGLSVFFGLIRFAIFRLGASRHG